MPELAPVTTYVRPLRSGELIPEVCRPPGSYLRQSRARIADTVRRMGFLDKLRGGDNAITVSVQPDEAAPGSAIAVRYEVTGELDAKARAVRVTLEGTANYKANVTRTYG